MNMKILISTDPEIPVPPEYYGGAERAAFHLINGFIANGFAVILIANENSKSSAAYKLYKWPISISTGFKSIIKNAFFMLNVIRQEEPEIILSYSRILYLYPSFLFTKHHFIKRYGRPVSGYSAKVADLIIGKRISYIVVAGHLIKNIKNKSKWTVIHNFTDTSYFTDINEGIKEYYLFLGRIEHIKGTYEAIQVAMQMKEKLIIAGNVEYENLEYFENKVKPYLADGKVEYVGVVNDEKKRKLLQNAKALLFPINWEEPFANVIPESLACGTPVYAFKRGCVAEAIIDGINGYAVTSINEMCEKLTLIDTLDRHNVRKSAELDFSVNASVKKHINLFEQISAKNVR